MVYKPKGPQKGVLRNAAVTLVGGVFGGGLMFVNEVLAARLLGVTVYGLYALAFVLSKISEIISLCGLRVALLHFIPIYREQGRPGKVSGVILSSVLVPALVSVACVMLLWYQAPWIAVTVFKEPEVLPYIRLMSIAIPFLAMSEILGNVTRGYGHSGYYVLIRNVVPPLVFFSLLLAMFSADVPFEWIAVAFVAAYLCGTVVGGFMVARIAGQDVKSGRPELEIGKLLGYAFPVLLNTVFYMAIGWSDILMTGFFRSSADVGIYRACMQVVILMDLVGIAFNAATSHIYPVLHNQGRRDELGAAYGRTLRWVAVIAVPAFVLVILNAGDILALLGPEFVAGSTALLILAGGQVIKICLGNAAFLLVITGHQKMETINALIAATVNVTLNYFLIPLYGLPGAAAASALSLLLLSCLRVLEVRKLMRYTTVRAPLIRIVLYSGAAALTIALLTTAAGLGNGQGFAVFASRVAVIVIVLAAVLWRTGLVESERANLRQLLSGFRQEKCKGEKG